ncbi:MAG: sulfotransferase [Acidimicrobiales bacterium]
MAAVTTPTDWTHENAVARLKPLVAFNAVLGVGGGKPAKRLFSLDPADLCAAARKKSGLDDLGPPTFWDGLVTYTSSFEEEARPTAMGRMAMRAQLVEALAARARVFDWAKAHPEPMATPVAPPLMICGLPRTGTTLLSHLVQADPGNRTLRHFEASDPAPPPVPGQEATDPRMIASYKQLEGLAKLAPGFQAMHPMTPEGATECVVLHAQEMTSVQLETQGHVPSYAAWLDAQDLHGVYTYERTALQVLQHGYDVQRWNLKTPVHLIAFDAIFDLFPDARMVWTHRDPAEVVVSIASLNTALHRVSSDHVDPVAVADHWCERLAGMVDRGMTYLDAHPDAPITHLAYADMMADPVGSVARVYADLDLELSDEARTSIGGWMAEHPQDKHGRHRYRADDFGLEPARVRDRFAPYCERFDT